MPIDNPQSSNFNLENKSEGKVGLIDLLKEDDSPDKEELELKSESKSKLEVKDEEAEEDEIEIKESKEDEEEIELKEDDEEIEKELETEQLITPHKRREILAKYPTLFKEFPYLEKGYYIAQRYTEIFPTPAEAREAQQRIESFTEFEDSLFSGDTEKILRSVKANNEEAFNKIADNYLTTLAKVDQPAAYAVLGNVIKNYVGSMVREGRRTNNEQLLAAANIVNQFVFGTSEYEQPVVLAKNNSKQDDSLKKEREDFMRERFEVTRADLDSKVTNMLKVTINTNIDPKGLMPEYVKNAANRDALEALQESIRNDEQFLKFFDGLWKKAFESKFSQDSTDKIRKAYIAKAKTLLPSIIQKSRNTALKGLGKRVKEDDKDRKGPIRVGGAAQTGNKNYGTNHNSSAQKSRPAGKSTYDILSED